MWVFAGLLILANPTVHLIDVLPDFIGAALVMIGIKNATYSIDYLKNSFGRFLALAIITLIRFGVTFTLGAMDGMTKLTVTFVFALAECVVFLPAVSKLYRGLDYMTIRFSDSNDRIGSVDKLKGITYAAFIIKEACSFLPLTAELMTTGDEVTGEYTSGPVAFIRVYYYFAIALALVFAVIYLVKLFKYLRLVDVDKGSVKAIGDKVAADRKEISLNAYTSRMKAALILALLANISCASFYVDGVNFLTPVLTAALLIAYFILVFNNNKILSCVGVVSCIGLIVVGVYNITKEAYYASQLYRPDSYAYGIRRAVPLYEEIERISLVQALILVFVTVIAIISMRSFLKSDAEKLNETVVDRGREAVRGFIPSTVAAGIVATAFIFERYVMPVYSLYWIFRSLACIVSAVIFGFAVRNAFYRIYFKLRQL